VAERDKPPVAGYPTKTAEPSAGDILEEDALNRVLSAEVKDRLERRISEFSYGAMLQQFPISCLVASEVVEPGRVKG
jgi:hypothetical protein